MKRIASFSVDHTTLKRGVYLSRTDGDVNTYDVRMKQPNQGDYLSNGALHTFEHLFATYARNSKYSESIVYVGPMGCRTGMYLLTRDTMSHTEVISLIKDTFEFIADFSGEIPGAKEAECGNYREHDHEGARREAAAMLPVLADWTPEKLKY